MRATRMPERAWPAASVSAKRVGLVLLALLFDLLLLSPHLSRSRLDPAETQRVYYEPGESGVRVLLDRAGGGYVTDVEVDEGGDLVIPAGRSIALAPVAEQPLVVRTLAEQLAPYLLIGRESAAPAAAARSLAGAVVVDAADTQVVVRRWDGARRWATDRKWLRDLRSSCVSGGTATVRRVGEKVAIEMGSCRAAIDLGEGGEARLIVVAGMHPAVVEKAGGWRQVRERDLAAHLWALARLGVLIAILGAAPAAAAGAVLVVLGWMVPAFAMSLWMLSCVFLLPAAVAAVVGRLLPQRPERAIAAGVLALVLEFLAAACLVWFFDLGSFGLVRTTRRGDDRCAIVGYSTVRGDSLRWQSDGIVERLDSTCAPCANRTSRFSREAQTLRWVREVVCAPTFPANDGGEVVFVGGGNDDIFYRRGNLRQLLGFLVNLVRFALDPVGAGDWQEAFAKANELAVLTLDDQADDIRAIAECARSGGRRLRFVHDFLIWDLEGGRPASRQQTFAARRQAVREHGGDFVDLLAEFQDSAGVAFFNDWIHPSGYAQRLIADRLCERLRVE